MGIIWVATDGVRRVDLDVDRLKFTPFESREDWEQHRHLVEAFDLPEYRADLHGKRIRSARATFFHLLPALCGMVVGWPLFALFSLYPIRNRIYRRTNALKPRLVSKAAQAGNE